MLINEKDWPIIAPHRYAGETIGRYTSPEITGQYAYVHHGRDISAVIKDSILISLNKDGTISGGNVGN